MTPQRQVEQDCPICPQALKEIEDLFARAKKENWFDEVRNNELDKLVHRYYERGLKEGEEKSDAEYDTLLNDAKAQGAKEAVERLELPRRIALERREAVEQFIQSDMFEKCLKDYGEKVTKEAAKEATSYALEALTRMTKEQDEA